MWNDAKIWHENKLIVANCRYVLRRFDLLGHFNFKKKSILMKLILVIINFQASYIIPNALGYGVLKNKSISMGIHKALVQGIFQHCF